MAYDHTLGMLVASKPSTNQLFPGYGLVKVGTLHNVILMLASQAYYTAFQQSFVDI